MDPALTVALISAGVSIVSAGFAAWTTRATTRLQDDLARRREAESREQQLEVLVSRYRDPLLLAAFDLQSRLYNIVRNDFLAYVRHGGEMERGYARDNTAFLAAQFFGWTEALRVDVQFLDLGDLGESRQLQDRLHAVRAALATDRLPDQRLRVFWGEQRAIGELMLNSRPANEPDTPRDCLGFAAFTYRLQNDPFFAGWMSKLTSDIEGAADDPEFDASRLIQVQHALIDLIDFLSKRAERFPTNLRTKA